MAVLVLLFPGVALTQQPSAAQVKFFESHIRPALVKYCYSCHSVDGESRGGLLLDTRQGWLQGGDGGQAIVPGKPEVSLLWEAINWEGYEMPPSKKMPADVIAKFKEWIEMGAPDPRERKILVHTGKISKEDIEKGMTHWAFQPPNADVDATIDSLVSKKLVEVGLAPVPPADQFTLLRRLYFDLVGLPPSPEEIVAFNKAWLKDADAAIDAKVEELLNRPQYGERWGRHWLDLARYAESSGSRNLSYPHAWRYRDYVIDSFNNDTPYDRFIMEQIAGDLLSVKTDVQWQQNLIGTGFLAIGLKHHDEKNPRKFIADLVDEQIDTTTQAILGLTVSCARCHDHKYDPIPTADYYALAGIFQSTQTYYGTSRVGQNHRPSPLLHLPIEDNETAVSRRVNVAAVKAKIAELERELRASKNGKEKREIRNKRNRLAAQLAEVNSDGIPMSVAMGVQDADLIVNANILLGGEVEKPAQQVPRGFIQLFGDLNFTVSDKESSGRLKLAEAMASKNNPLTARVMVNRIWMHLLGRPLVGTPSNFGVSGIKPENQELLDYLAVRFMDEGWSVKSIIREIVTSATYRRSSSYSEVNDTRDPDNVFLWRVNPRHIDAEALRDAMLAVAGQLDLERPRGSAVGVSGRPGAVDPDANNPYRSIYLPIVRDQLPAALDLFNFADPNATNAGRSHSIVPTQALYLMNNQFVTSQAQAMAMRLENEYTHSDEQIRYAFAYAYGRPASKDELKASEQFFREFDPSRLINSTSSSGESGPERRGSRGRRNQGSRRGGQENAELRSVPRAKNQALAVFCQALMASARFRILD